MNIHDEVAITMPYWRWMFLLGWLRSQQANSGWSESGELDDVANAIAGSVQP
jgi:hypothetical protein